MLNKYVIIPIIAVIAISAFLIGQNVGNSSASQTSTSSTMTWPNIHQNVQTDFNNKINSPQIENDSFIHPFAVVIGDCHIGKMVLMAPTSVCRGDEGTPIFIGDYSNVQDGVVLHALETTIDRQYIDDPRFSATADSLLANDYRFDGG